MQTDTSAEQKGAVVFHEGLDMSRIIRLPRKLKSIEVADETPNSVSPTLEQCAAWLKDPRAAEADIVMALTEAARFVPEAIDSSKFDVKLLIRFANSPHNEIRAQARNAICQLAECIAPHHAELVHQWKEKIMEVVGLDCRTTRFVQLYPRVVDLADCLSAVGKWLIQDDSHELVRFFLYLELESHIPTRRKELSEIASDFIDFCGYSYFRDCYPEAVDYMVGLAEGECLPRVEKPSPKTFSRLCSFKQHDKLSQLMLAAVVSGDLDRVDWFTRNVFPVHFEHYSEYERSLVELIGSESMPHEVRENALTALMSLGDEHLCGRPYFEEFIELARSAFSHSDLEMLCIPEMNPRTSRRLLSKLALVR